MATAIDFLRERWNRKSGPSLFLVLLTWQGNGTGMRTSHYNYTESLFNQKDYP